MSHQPNKPSHHRKLSDTEFAVRYKAEKILQQRRYCDIFVLWRRCTSRRCRRERACAGDHAACLKCALPALPHTAQWQARQEILATTPNNIGAPERAARQCMPVELYVESSAQVVSDYFARFEQKRPPPPR